MYEQLLFLLSRAHPRDSRKVNRTAHFPRGREEERDENKRAAYDGRVFNAPPYTHFRKIWFFDSLFQRRGSMVIRVSYDSLAMHTGVPAHTDGVIRTCLGRASDSLQICPGVVWGGEVHVYRMRGVVVKEACRMCFQE